MKGCVRRTHHSAGGTKCSAHDSCVRCDRAESTGANLCAHRAPHESQCAGDAAADHDQIGIKDVKEGRDRDAKVIARRREGAKGDAIPPLRRAGLTAHAEVPFLIEVTLRQPAAWGELALDQFLHTRCRGIRLEASTRSAIAGHASRLDRHMPELGRHSVASMHQLAAHDKPTPHAGAQSQEYDIAMSARSAPPELSERPSVRIVLDRNPASERFFQSGPQRK